MRSFVCKLFPAFKACLLQTFCISSLTIHPPTITTSIFAVRNFLASGAIGKSTLAACSAFSTCWSRVYVSDSALYSSVWEHFGVCVEIIWWWSSYPCIGMFQLRVDVHRTFDSLVDIPDNYSRYDIPVWDWASGVDENSRRPFSTIRGGCVCTRTSGAIVERCGSWMRSERGRRTAAVSESVSLTCESAFHFV